MTYKLQSLFFFLFSFFLPLFQFAFVINTTSNTIIDVGIIGMSQHAIDTRLSINFVDPPNNWKLDLLALYNFVCTPYIKQIYKKISQVNNNV